MVDEDLLQELALFDDENLILKDNEEDQTVFANTSYDATTKLLGANKYKLLNETNQDSVHLSLNNVKNNKTPTSPGAAVINKSATTRFKQRKRLFSDVKDTSPAK